MSVNRRRCCKKRVLIKGVVRVNPIVLLVIRPQRAQILNIRSKRFPLLYGALDAVYIPHSVTKIKSENKSKLANTVNSGRDCFT